MRLSKNIAESRFTPGEAALDRYTPTIANKVIKVFKALRVPNDLRAPNDSIDLKAPKVPLHPDATNAVEVYDLDSVCDVVIFKL